MSSKGANLHHKRQQSETENARRLPDMDAAQQLKLRERQRFFEEAFQHDVDVYFPSSHLQIDYKRPPMSSISSMEVNVDMLEQMDLLDISDQEALDVFLASTDDDDTCSCPVEGLSSRRDIDAALTEDISMRVPGTCEMKTRISSTSSTTTSDSQEEEEEDDDDGAETPVVQSDDEDVHADDGLLINGTPPVNNAGEEDLSL